MKKIIVTESQYKKILGIDEQNISINRVDKNFRKTFRDTDIKELTPNDALMEEPNIESNASTGSDGKKFDIKKQVNFTNPPIANNKMVMKPEPKPINEDVFNQEIFEAVKEFLNNLWMNPSQRGLSTFFKRNGLTWGDIMSFLTLMGITTGIGAGIYKINNVFKRVFSKDKRKAVEEKQEEIEKIAAKIAANPKAPWNKEPEAKKIDVAKTIFDRNANITRGINKIAGIEETPSSFRNEPEREDEAQELYNPIYMGKEVAILNGPDGMYVFDHSEHDLGDLDSVANYINHNLDNISKGTGLKAFDSGDDLVKIDEELKEELRSLYAKDKDLVNTINKMEEMTSTASVGGGFTGPLGAAGKPNISPNYTPAKQIKIINNEEELYGNKVSEDGQKHQKMGDKIVGKLSKSLNRGKKSTTDDLRAQHYEPDRTRPNYPLKNDDLPLDKYLKAKADGQIEETDSSASPGYVGPQIWAKDKANWAAAHRTQYPGGEMVDFDPCTKLNNNKAAQSGKCSQGAVDKVVKTHKTKDSVISKSMYETIAKKTGRTIDDVKRIIELKIKKQ